MEIFAKIKELFSCVSAIFAERSTLDVRLLDHKYA